MLNYAITNLHGDYLATGHYAKLINNLLYKPKDLEKDQTYFLSQLSKKQLKKIIFPLADYLKSEVRNIATKIKLNVANKKDSTGICFIGERKFGLFVF